MLETAKYILIFPPWGNKINYFHISISKGIPKTAIRSKTQGRLYHPSNRNVLKM